MSGPCQWPQQAPERETTSVEIPNTVPGEWEEEFAPDREAVPA